MPSRFLFLIEFGTFYLLDFSDLHVWQIKNKKLINKGTSREYSYDASKHGYNLDGVIIEERYIENYPKQIETAEDKWKFCQEDDETFRIKCTTSDSFLRAKSHYDPNRIIKGDSLLLPKIIALIRFSKKKRIPKCRNFFEKYYIISFSNILFRKGGCIQQSETLGIHW